MIWATPGNQAEPDKTICSFRFDLARGHVAVDIAAKLGIAAFAARADGKMAEVRICGEIRDKPIWDNAWRPLRPRFPGR